MWTYIVTEGTEKRPLFTASSRKKALAAIVQAWDRCPEPKPTQLVILRFTRRDPNLWQEIATVLFLRVGPADDAKMVLRVNHQYTRRTFPEYSWHISDWHKGYIEGFLPRAWA